MKNKLHKDITKHAMFGSHYFISLSYKVANPLVKGSIIDVETTGLDPSTDKIITLGIIKKNHLLIYQLHDDSYHRFWSLCHHIVKEQPIPRYGYACSFEADFLKINDDKWRDLTEYLEVHYDYENPFRRYSLHDLTFHPFHDEPIDIDGFEIPQEWQQYLKTKKTKHLTNIIFHCVCDLHRTKQLIEKNINSKI